MIEPTAFQHQRRNLLGAGLLLPLGCFSGAGRAASATARGAPEMPLMLAKPWQSTLNPAEFLVSEKLDGVRAFWDGRQLHFRSGRPIAAPAWFLVGLPAEPLDGELWMGRRSFDALSAAVRKAVAVDSEWRAVRYMVFDTPQAGGSFAQRNEHIEGLVAAAKLGRLQAVAQTRVPDAERLRSLLMETVGAGGEGLVLHHADALWVPGRSDALRKLKPEPDEEGRVVALLPGTGKYQGRMGALLVETSDGKRFSLGTGFSDALRANPPAVGSVVSYRYRDHTASGLPKFPSFLRVREAE